MIYHKHCHKNDFKNNRNNQNACKNNLQKDFKNCHQNADKTNCKDNHQSAHKNDCKLIKNSCSSYVCP
jgi:hypothetical protein